ncbi:lysophospholipid acyltransferase family protein [Phycisphaera mikurensis]|uniref:Putative acyltransferase n=1 Tax=Phycisphaera mikurensis (strain NBRC 102666 / KCTC 22515 / FYK2301M01) TaxID=1142394 RepID=I0IBD9_PHYMF|nr:lysophospholipid acyltransferase family protein [Phycisphaera mikurensis]MBB6442890.1 1-acyl-sn-glycerol-3-phosphate acyltransferase [Phycisphaera mikurensis]BAM02577.1 putative acyltransferase [Phycisphaera mikurensis NBRC 102666]
MSDAIYDLLCAGGRPVWTLCTSPTVLHAERAKLPPPFLVAANHEGPFDIPMLMRHVPQRLDFLSIVEVFSRPLLGPFYRSMNAFPLDRSRPDAATVRVILDRLARGRCVAMFPEGGFRRGRHRVTAGGRIRPGLGGLARLAGVPVLPAVMAGGERFAGVRPWLPTRSVRYGVAFGEAMDPPADPAGERPFELAFEAVERGLAEQLRAVGVSGGRGP